MTACRECVHLVNLGSSIYEKQCALVPLMYFDPFSGMIKQIGFEQIAKVNFGACPKFEAKEPEA